MTAASDAQRGFAGYARIDHPGRVLDFTGTAGSSRSTTFRIRSAISSRCAKLACVSGSIREAQFRPPQKFRAVPDAVPNAVKSQ